jgi:uncharacterized protein YndB with AHSA1/START domain
MTTATKSTDIRLQVTKFIRAKRERVFAAWTQPELMKKWHAPGNMTAANANSDPRPGGAYRVDIKAGADEGDCGDSIVTGRYTKVIPNELLVFTWQWEGSESPETLVTVALKDVPGGTELTLTHERFPAEEARDKHEHGWNGCLANLAGLAERGGLAG